MEALLSSRIIPIRASYRRYCSPSFPALSLRLNQSSHSGRVGMMKHPKSLNSVAASVKPLESILGHIDNTVPSKGCIVNNPSVLVSLQGIQKGKFLSFRIYSE